MEQYSGNRGLGVEVYDIHPSTRDYLYESQESPLYIAFQDTRAIERDPVSKGAGTGEMILRALAVCSSRGPRLHSQYPHSGPQSSVIPVAGDSSGILRYQTQTYI